MGLSKGTSRLIIAIGAFILQFSETNQCFLPCSLNIGLDTSGCCPRFGLQIGGSPCCCQPKKGLCDKGCPCIPPPAPPAVLPPPNPCAACCPPPNLPPQICPTCPCNDKPIIPQVIEYGPPCPPPRLQNLPFELESPFTPCAPSCKQYNYQVQKPSCCNPCSDCIQPLLNLPPAVVEVPLDKPACPCQSYKYEIIKPAPTPLTECQPKINLPFITEQPCNCNNLPVSGCCNNCKYAIQQATVPRVDVPKCLNIGYSVESPVSPPLTCLNNLKSKIDRLLVPRKCPCICDQALKGNICNKARIPPMFIPPVCSPVLFNKEASLKLY